MPRSNELRIISEFIDKKYITYPFAMRWLQSEFKSLGEFKIRRTLNELSSLDAIEAFPVLVEKKKGMVAQSEKEMIVQKDGCEVVTK
jgi:methionyl aminopeptidase